MSNGASEPVSTKDINFQKYECRTRCCQPTEDTCPTSNSLRLSMPSVSKQLNASPGRTLSSFSAFQYPSHIMSLLSSQMSLDDIQTVWRPYRLQWKGMSHVFMSVTGVDKFFEWISKMENPSVLAIAEKSSLVNMSTLETRIISLI